jgi:hypothetical protein
MWDSNLYCASFPFPFLLDATQTLTFAQWKSTNGFDADSVMTAVSPTNVQVFVRTNAYEPGRANIIVYDWSLTNTVSADVSGILTTGASYEVRNAQNFFGPVVLSGRYNGTPLQLPMTNLTVATPVGFNNPPPPTGPAFNVFVLLTTTNFVLLSPQHLRILK